jgi:hypothetical protein
VAPLPRHPNTRDFADRNCRPEEIRELLSSQSQLDQLHVRGENRKPQLMTLVSTTANTMANDFGINLTTTSTIGIKNRLPTHFLRILDVEIIADFD